MEVEFADRDLSDRFLNSELARRAWGDVVARSYGRRVNQIRAAARFSDLTALRALRVHSLKGARKGQWAMEVHGRWRLVFTVDGDLIRILEVSNHYDD